MEIKHWRLDGLQARAPGDAIGPEAEAFDAIAPDPVFGGFPLTTGAASAFDVLTNLGYTVGYSESRRNPLWAAYRLFPVTDPETHERPSRFRVDERTHAQVNHDCYTNQGYDRGHNAPNSAIDTRYGEAAQKETFLLSNVSPQLCGNNREPWQGLEHIIGETYATQYAEIYVINGPVFGAQSSSISCDVQVPVGFYKIVVEPQSSAVPRVLAVVMAQEDAGWFHRIRDFVTTVDCIENLTGLDFFPALADAVEDQIEAAAADESWELDTVTRPTFGCPGFQDAAIGNARRAMILQACDD